MGISMNKRIRVSQRAKIAYWYGSQGYNFEEDRYAIYLTCDLEYAQRMCEGNDIYVVDLEKMRKDGYKLMDTANYDIIVDSDTITEEYIIEIIRQ